MVALILGSSNLPPWMTGPNMLYVGLYGYGAMASEGRVIEAHSLDTKFRTKGLNSEQSFLGGGAFLRWNTLGVSLDFNEGYFYRWIPNYEDTTYHDTSFTQSVLVSIAKYMNNYSWTHVAFTLESRRFAFGYGIPFPDTSDPRVKEKENFPIPNSDVRYFSLGLSGRFYLEVEAIYSEGKGLLPWIGGHVAWIQLSYSSRDPFGDASAQTNTVYMKGAIGLEYYVQPWMGFFLEGNYSSLSASSEVSNVHPKYENFYDHVKVGMNRLEVKAGLKLTWRKERY